MRTKYRQPSSQYVFGYQKFILMPEDHKATKSGKVNVKLPEVVGKGYGTFWRWKGRYRAVKSSSLRYIRGYRYRIVTWRKNRYTEKY